MIFFILSTVSYNSAKKKEYMVYADQLVRIGSLVLREDPEIVTGKNAHIDLRFLQYEKRFQIGDHCYSCSFGDSIRYGMYKGDTVSIGMLASDVVDMDEEHLVANYNPVYSLQFKQKEYIDLDCRNGMEKKEKEEGSVFYLVFGALALLIALFPKNPYILVRNAFNRYF